MRVIAHQPPPRLLIGFSEDEAQDIVRQIEQIVPPNPNREGCRLWSTVPALSRLHDALRDFAGGHLEVEGYGKAHEYEVS